MFPQTYDELPKVYCSCIRMMKDGKLLKQAFDDEVMVLKALKKKKVEGAIFPIELYRVLIYGFLVYSQQNVKDAYPLSSFRKYESLYNDREILSFFRQLLLIERNLHQAGVVSGDITYSNILIDANLDIHFIDFNYAFVDDLVGSIARVPKDEVPFAVNTDLILMESMYSLKDQFQYYDKASLINMILYALSSGTFPADRLLPTFSSYERLDLKPSQKQAFEVFLSGKKRIAEDEYLLDVFDDLIAEDYPLPYRKLRK